MTGANFLNKGEINWGALLGNGNVYHVPNFQRDFSWGEEEWDDLWNDILALNEEELHYMSYIVLQSDDDKNFTIIDGQQRFTTLSILALAVIQHIEEMIGKNIEADDNRQRIELLRNSFLGYKDPASLIPTSKLFLNRNNDDFYQSFLLRLRKPSDLHKRKPSEKKLWRAFEYFYDKLKTHFGDRLSGPGLAQFLGEKVARQLIFTTIQVSDDLTAYKVFETLNARGVKLSTTDLLKNYLFSVVAQTSPAELTEAERQWQSINNTLGAEDFTTFLRHFWNSRHSIERKSMLFKAIKKAVQTSQEVFALLGDLEGLAPVYLAFSQPEDERWDKTQRRRISELALFDVSQCYSLLLAAYNKLDQQEFTGLLRLCVIISFRYQVIGGLNPNALEDAYNRAALKIIKGEAITVRQVFQELKNIYVSDESFDNDFTSKSFDTGSSRGKKLARYVLFSLENHLENKDYDYEDATATIEHILPESPDEEWDTPFPAKEQENFVYRLGNLTLLEKTKNKDCGNKKFADKLPVYQTSSYRLTAKETNYIDWTPEKLHQRQEKMAGWATSIWRVNY